MLVVVTLKAIALKLDKLFFRFVCDRLTTVCPVTCDTAIVKFDASHPERPFVKLLTLKRRPAYDRFRRSQAEHFPYDRCDRNEMINSDRSCGYLKAEAVFVCSRDLRFFMSA